ncbi:MAG: DUF523 domain-containing protein [Bacillota bacterium]
MKEKGPILVSACLAGVKCRYDGGHNNVPEINEMVERGLAIPVCPEILGGGGIPREPYEIVGGDGGAVLDGKARVKTPSGNDGTELFVRGAEEVLRAANKCNAVAAVLKERSPSCGSSMIYDGTFTGGKIPGMGVAAAILQRAGIKVYSEEDFKAKGIGFGLWGKCLF